MILDVWMWREKDKGKCTSKICVSLYLRKTKEIQSISIAGHHLLITYVQKRERDEGLLGYLTLLAADMRRAGEWTTPFIDPCPKVQFNRLYIPWSPTEQPSPFILLTHDMRVSILSLSLPPELTQAATAPHLHELKAARGWSSDQGQLPLPSTSSKRPGLIFRPGAAPSRLHELKAARADLPAGADSSSCSTSSWSCPTATLRSASIASAYVWWVSSILVLSRHPLRFSFWRIMFTISLMQIQFYPSLNRSKCCSKGICNRRPHGLGCTDTGYRYIHTVIQQLRKIRIHRYGKYIYNFINKYYEGNAQS
jgi:hypothetical protein